MKMNKWVSVISIAVLIYTLFIVPASATFISGGITSFDISVKGGAVNSVYVFVPDTGTTGKVSGVGAASAIDWSSIGYLLSLFDNPQRIVKDTDTTYVDTSTGSPLFATIGAATILAFAGPGVNNVVHYFETVDPTIGGATVRYGTDGTNAYWTVYGSKITATSTALSSLGNTLDLFVIEAFTDGAGGRVYIIYGLGGFGTMAAGVFIRFNFYQYGTVDPGSITGATANTLIYKWTDGTSAPANNKFPDFSGGAGPDGWSLLYSGP